MRKSRERDTKEKNMKEEITRKTSGNDGGERKGKEMRKEKRKK